MPISDFFSFDILRDGSNAKRAPNYVDTYVLTAGTAQAVAIPTVNGKKPKRALFSADAPFMAGYTPTGQAQPTVASVNAKTDGTGCEVSPVSRMLAGVESMSIVARTAATVSIEYCY